MSKDAEKHWQEELNNFQQAFDGLERACSQYRYNYLEIVGLACIFEFTLEKGLNALRALLEREGRVAESPEQIIQTGFNAWYLEEDERKVFLEALELRGSMKHIDNFEEAERTKRSIINYFHPLLGRLLSTLEDQL